jgi:hypothetical protein
MDNVCVSFAYLAYFHKNYLVVEMHSDALLIVLSGTCRQALSLLKDSHADKKNGIEGRYREARLFLW